MKYETLTRYTDEAFRRITGLKRSTFDEILKILCEAYKKKNKNVGRKSKLKLP